MCPYCRVILHKSHLPPREKAAINHELLDERAISAMPVEQRPLRAARETYVVARERTKSLLDQLIAKRERLRCLGNPTINKPQACNSGEALVITSSSKVYSHAAERRGPEEKKTANNSFTFKFPGESRVATIFVPVCATKSSF